MVDNSNGRVKKKLDPFPSSLSTSNVPPIRRTKSLLIVNPRPVPPYSFTMLFSACSPKINKLKKGKTATLTTKLTGVSGKVKWKTSNKKIATVSSKGKVKGKKKGTATITAYIGKVKSSVKIKIY